MTGFATAGEGSENVLVPSTHDALDHTVGPLSLLDATAHDTVDHAALTTPLMTVAAHNVLDHTTEAGTNVNPAQVSPGERTAGSEGTLRSFSPFDVATMADIHGGGAGLIQTKTASTNVSHFSNTQFIAQDNTIPTTSNFSLDGVNSVPVLTVSITPTNSSNRLRVTALFHMGRGGEGGVGIGILKDAESLMRAVAFSYVRTNAFTTTVEIIYEVAATSTSNQDWKVFITGYAGQITYMNRPGVGERYAGRLISSLTVKEVLP